MAKQEKDTKVGNWATAESVPRTQLFDQAQGKVGGRTPTNQNGQAFVEDGQLRPINSDAAKTEDSKPRRGSGNSRRADRPSVCNEDVVRKSSTNPHRQRNEDPEKYIDDKQRSTRSNDSNRESKPAERAARNPTSDKRLASEGTPGRIRTKANTTPSHDDVAVPPFAEWDENDPASGEKYTGIFKLIAENRRTPGPSYQPPEPNIQPKTTTEAQVITTTYFLNKLLQRLVYNHICSRDYDLYNEKPQMQQLDLLQ
ncbi:uncharacterized protein LOC141833569 isoform X1 [Curcuma longa]|uniref:uncharacterized protein LOC141833569 isoform X1 n=1 Tax=Curcuma longa TaxID=136217 RepID=UPI003D9DB179